jgi:hypothetical protein
MVWIYSVNLKSDLYTINVHTTDPPLQRFKYHQSSL